MRQKGALWGKRNAVIDPFSKGAYDLFLSKTGISTAIFFANTGSSYETSSVSQGRTWWLRHTSLQQTTISSMQQSNNLCFRLSRPFQNQLFRRKGLSTLKGPSNRLWKGFHCKARAPMYSRKGMVSVVFKFVKHGVHFENAAKITKTGSDAMAKQKQRSPMQHTHAHNCTSADPCPIHCNPC